MLSPTQVIERLKLDQFGTRNLFGLPVLAATMDQAVEICERAIQERVQIMTGQLSGPVVARMQRSTELAQGLREANVFFAEGAGVVLAARLLDRPVPERIAGIDLMHRLMQLAEQRGYRVYLLGAEPWVLESVVESFSRDHPGAVLAGYHHGYFDDAQSEAIAHSIRESQADILFVAMTSPLKERFQQRWGEVTGVSVLHGVGGSFDCVAGKVQRAPEWVQRASLEWAYRIYQEPRRMWRREGIGNLLFVGLLLWHLVAKALRE
jgi:N-acetylglucosaminyldiphosphoundecaprenol N-acetyl-beta-D-mannosaminyltransferase